MKKYCKPVCLASNGTSGIVPLVAASVAEAVTAVSSLSAAGAAAVGAAAGLGIIGGRDDLPVNSRSIREQIAYDI